MDKKMIKILFSCTYQGARSRIAEEFAKEAAGDQITVFSSCFEAARIGKLPVAVMKEIGIELPTTSPKTIYGYYKDHEKFDYIITMCQTASAEMCTTLKDNISALYGEDAELITWSIPAFMSLKGSEEKRLEEARLIRDIILKEVLDFLVQQGVKGIEA